MTQHPRGAALIWLSLLTALTMVAFAANSLLARLAFQTTSIDAASFTALRIISGAFTLLLALLISKQKITASPSHLLPTVLLFIYTVAFSFAYRFINTGTGALILFATAQLLMTGYGVYRGERASVIGMIMALAGLLLFLGPGAAPPLAPSLLMALAGFAWGGFCLLGKRNCPPTTSTAMSFLWATPLALLLMVLCSQHLHLDARGVAYALTSGSLTSGLGYIVWYRVRLQMPAISAGAVQLSVPVLSAAFGFLLLQEAVTLKEALSALLVLAGIALIIVKSKR